MQSWILEAHSCVTQYICHAHWKKCVWNPYCIDAINTKGKQIMMGMHIGTWSISKLKSNNY